MICKTIRKTTKWPNKWTKYLTIPIHKKGDSTKFSNYRTLSLISHPRKIILIIILNRLIPQAEFILTEEYAGFRKSRSTIEQIINIRLIIVKNIEIQKKVYQNT